MSQCHGCISPLSVKTMVHMGGVKTLLVKPAWHGNAVQASHSTQRTEGQEMKLQHSP